MARRLTMKRLGTPMRSDPSLVSDEWADAHEQASSEVPRRRRAVIYARYSTENQDENSIQRQVEAATAYIERIGAELAKPRYLFVDMAKSGALMVGRDGLHAVLSSVAHDMFDLVVVEDADRLARDIGHLGDVYRTCQHHNVELHAAMRGKLGLAEIAMYGFLSADQRDQLRIRTREGSKLAAEEGRAPKGSIYGYRPAPQGRGFLVVDEEQAKVVHRIYTMFDEGVPVREIARILNREEIPSPYGKTWSAAAIRGSAKHGSGILRNHRYKGLLVYNRTETRKHPDTGKRKLLPRPRGDWVVVPVEHWIIVDPELWARVQRRLGAPAKDVPARRSSVHEPLFPKRIFCDCGAPLMSVTKHAAQGRRLQCSSFVEKGTCTIGHSVGLVYVERNLLRMVRDGILGEATVDAFEAEYLAECVRIAKDNEAARTALSARIAQIDAEIERTWDKEAMAGFSQERVSLRRSTWERELRAKRAALNALPRTDLLPKPDPLRARDLRAGVTELIDRIPTAFETEGDQILAAAIRGIVSRVDLRFAPGGRGYTLRLEGRLDGLLHAADRTGAVVPVVRKIEATFGPTEWGRMADPDRRAKLTALAESGRYGLGDEDWVAVRGCFEHFDLRTLDARSVIDAALFHLRAEVPISRLPRCFGHFATVRAALMRMVQKGHWHSATAILRNRNSEAVRDLDLSAFDRWTRGATAELKGSEPQVAVRRPVDSSCLSRT